jgi:L-alanine-DL-glutamate epimerase-like enolase superfamily enzyme
LGEVRDAGNENMALGMKPLLVGKNPIDISGILQAIRPYAGPGRQGGGFSGIDIALHDITGKLFGVPVWRLLGDKKRDRVRMYCDTTGTPDPKKYGERMVERMKSWKICSTQAVSGVGRTSRKSRLIPPRRCSLARTRSDWRRASSR